MYLSKSRYSYSTLITTFLFLALLLFAFYVEFFYSKVDTTSKNNFFTSPIDNNILSRISTIKIKNRVGSFLLTQNKNEWLLEEPKKIPANKIIIDQVINTLKGLSTKTLHSKDPINLQSFALNKPLVEIHIITKLEESLILKLGLINPVTENTFMLVNDQNLIYEISKLNFPLEQLELSSIIDTRVFNVELDTISEFSVFHYEQLEPRNKLTKTTDGWTSKRYKHINDKKTEQKIQSILSIQPHIIIDGGDEETTNYIENYLKNPRYRVQIRLKNETTITYKISSIIRSIESLKIENKNYFIIEASNRPYPFIVHKDYLDRFLIQYKDISS